MHPRTILGCIYVNRYTLKRFHEVEELDKLIEAKYGAQVVHD